MWWLHNDYARVVHGEGTGRGRPPEATLWAPGHLIKCPSDSSSCWEAATCCDAAEWVEACVRDWGAAVEVRCM